MTKKGIDNEKIQDIKIVLDAWGFPLDQRFLSPDGLVVVALLCNAAAKAQSWGFGSKYPDFYDLKPGLIETAARCHIYVWKEVDGDSFIVYFETCVGQISFHVFPEEGEFFDLLPDANGREWRGGYMQDFAGDIASAFLYCQKDPLLEAGISRFLRENQGF